MDLEDSDLTLLETLSGAKPSHDHPEDRSRRAARDGGEDGAGGEDGEQLREEDEEEEEEEEGEAAKFCTAWLLCIGSATVGCLLAKVRGGIAMWYGTVLRAVFVRKCVQRHGLNHGM